MGLRTWLGIKKKREPRTFLGRYPDVSPDAALTADILFEHPAFTDYIHRRINGREPNAPRMNKIAMTAFASKLGFRVSETFAELSNVSDLDLKIFPERFVVKPSELWSTRE
jgi:hypothetical protein